MEASNTSVPSESRLRYWLRVLRPLVWWVLLVLALYGYRKQQEWSERTRLRFSTTIEGRPLFLGEASATLDGARIDSGERVSIGRHTFTITHPKAETYSTNLFFWYGEHDLGEIVLKRITGILKVQVNPAAMTLSIRGPEFTRMLTNSAGITSTVPPDHYLVTAKYPYWEKTFEVTVFAGSTASLPINPPLGTVRITGSPSGIFYQLQVASDGQLMKSGELPATIAGLPEGDYKLIAKRGRDGQEKNLTIKAGATNDLRVEFQYGAASLETEPNGASVMNQQGEDWGVTPLNLPELKTGHWEFTLRKQGFEQVLAILEIENGQTNVFRTNLVNTAYLEAMNNAHMYFVAGDYDRAAQAAGEALRIQSDDPVASDLRREASGHAHLDRAKALGARSDYINAAKELESVFTFLPDNAEAKELKSEYAKRQQTLAEEQEKKRQQTLAEKERQERMTRAKLYFGQWMLTTTNSGLFDEQELKVKGTLADLETKLVQALTNTEPVFKLVTLKHPKPEVFSVRAVLDLGSGGWRRCDLVGGQSSDGEVTFVFKVFEYSYVEAFSIRALIKDNDEKNMVPINASRIDPAKTFLLQRRSEGIRLVSGRIRQVARE